MRNYIGNFDGLKLFYILGHYPNGRLSLIVTSVDKNGFEDDYAVVTINLPEANIPENGFTDSCGTVLVQDFAFINADLDEEFKQWLRDNHVISYPFRTVQYNMGHYELCEILVAQQK